MEEITGILVDLFILFTAAKVAGELFTRARQPALVGEVLVGVRTLPLKLEVREFEAALASTRPSSPAARVPLQLAR